MTIKRLTVNPATGELDVIGIIPQLTSDPASPQAEDAWVKATIVPGAGTGVPYGLLLALTKPGSGGSATYELSYRTKEGTTKRVTLS